jgi:hypothetical protein
MPFIVAATTHSGLRKFREAKDERCSTIRSITGGQGADLEAIPVEQVLSRLDVFGNVTIVGRR